MDEGARRVQATLAEVAGEQGLLDECGWEKAGTKRVGVGRPYIGQVGKISNGQVGVFAVLSWGPSAGLVGRQLYLPQAWSSDAARCAQARVPLAARAYRNKPALAALVEHRLGQGLVRADWVGATRPMATCRPCGRPCSSAGRRTCSTWGRGSSCIWPTRPPQRPPPGRAGAARHAGRSPWARPWPCRKWPLNYLVLAGSK